MNRDFLYNNCNFKLWNIKIKTMYSQFMIGFILQFLQLHRFICLLNIKLLALIIEWDWKSAEALLLVFY